MNYMMVVGAGLLAGATTCAVTQGGLLVGLITRQRKAAGMKNEPARNLADDLTPVGSFLAGKFVSHTAAGFLLGAAGSAFGFNARIGAAAQLLAGLVIIVLGLGALGGPGFAALQFTPPESWLNVVRKSTRSQSAVAPFMLGLAVLLVPCGVTISMEILAASSGSPLTGAAVMGLFVIGTAPMFALYGYVTQRMRINRAMSAALAAVVVAFGLITLNAGLVAAGSPVTAQALLPRHTPVAATPTATLSSGAVATPGTTTAPGAVQIVNVEARSGGYVPSVVTAKAGSPIRLTFTTHNVFSCIRATTMPTLGKQLVLPQDGSGSVDLGVLAAGDYPISCSMGMYSATLHVTA
jgi:sulfite exporter TauE/SafE